MNKSIEKEISISIDDIKSACAEYGLGGEQIQQIISQYKEDIIQQIRKHKENTMVCMFMVVYL